MSLGLCKCLIFGFVQPNYLLLCKPPSELESLLSLYVIFKLYFEPVEAGSLRAQSLMPSVPLISAGSLNGQVILHCFTSPHHVWWMPGDAAHAGLSLYAQAGSSEGPAGQRPPCHQRCLQGMGGHLQRCALLPAV